MKAILFDFDGTLVDTQIWYNLAISNVLSEFNKCYTPEFCSDYFDGRCWQDIINKIAKEEKFNPNEILDNAVSLAHKMILENITVNDGVFEVMEVLAESNVRYAICSNSQTHEIHAALEKSGLGKFFDSNVFGRNLVKNGKPASDIYLYGLEKLGVRPNETFAVEDSTHGAKASIDANIPTVIFSGASHFKPAHKEKFTTLFGTNMHFFANMIEAMEYMVYAK